MSNRPIAKTGPAANAASGAKSTKDDATAEKRRPQRSNTKTKKRAVGTTQTIVPAVVERAQQMGLLAETRQVGARLPTKLLKQARKRTGIASTTDLLTFALANVAVEDDFAKAFVAARGTLDPDLDIGF